MKESTLEKYRNILDEIEKSDSSIKSYCELNDLNYGSVLAGLNSAAREDVDISERLANLKHTVTSKEEVDTSSNKIWYDRDDNGKIVGYSYEIFRKGKEPLIGTLTREEMGTIYRLYTYYGTNLTARQVTRYFPQFSLPDFKRVIKAFEIYKASSPFPPHYFEEYSEDELRDIQLREKENDFLRRAEEDRIKNNEKLLRKYANENIELKQKLEDLSEIEFKINTNDLEPVKLTGGESSDINLNLFIADLHIGAKVNSGSLYGENYDYDRHEIVRRMTYILQKISNFGHLNHLRLSLLGDNVDCCGIDGMTSRLDHVMPESMDSIQQGQVFIDIMNWFVGTIVKNNLANKISVISVPCGNHGGTFEYMINVAVMNLINARYPDVETQLFTTFYAPNVFCNHLYVLTHGKDHKFMKKPMPLHLEDKTKNMIYEYLQDNKLLNYENIHVIKGDLHSEAFDSCKIFDYRNVLSLFGASDYSSMNYSRNSWGMSYDLFIGDNLIRGSFINM